MVDDFITSFHWEFTFTTSCIPRASFSEIFEKYTRKNDLIKGLKFQAGTLLLDFILLQSQLLSS